MQQSVFTYTSALIKDANYVIMISVKQLVVIVRMPQAPYLWEGGGLSNPPTPKIFPSKNMETSYEISKQLKSRFDKSFQTLGTLYCPNL